MRLLCLSNGHGEDTIALQVLKALRQLPHAPSIDVLPIVGEGHAYAKQGFNRIGNVKQMPSGGFIYMDGKQLAKDIQGGLLKLTLQQLKTVRQWSQNSRAQNSTSEPSIILAVGDIVPLIFAWQSGLNYAFIGTAKSEYYLRDETQWHPRNSWWDDRLARMTGSVYYPWERWLLGRPNCKASFPRDRITAQQLQQFGLPAYDFGNPMMDLDLAPMPGESTENPRPHPVNLNPNQPLKILLLPGSRAPEAYRNWDLLLQSVQNLVEQFSDRSIQFLAALSPELDRTELQTALTTFQWMPQAEGNTFTHPHSPHRITLGVATFSDFAHQADLAIAMAGTATEQFVGLGKPAITLPGQGPQFTPAFAEAQTRLLGCSILPLNHPTQISETLKTLLQDPDRLVTIARNGQQRMGQSGSGARIAQKLIQILDH